MSALVDPFGRHMRKLRVSLTESCNFHCFHCMKEEVVATPPAAWLSPAELEEMVRRLAAMGIQEVRLTGGEPTLRPELLEIVTRLGRLRLKRRGITSNGALLEPMLPALQVAGLDNLNLSLDSLDAAVFERITGVPGHAAILRCLERALGLGLQVKVNVVVFRGLNDHEAPEFARLAEREGVAVRFLELMRIGPDHEANRRYFVPASETMARLKDAGMPLRRIPARADSTARQFRTRAGGRIGFIASPTMPFCQGCSRLRLSASGFLRACLMREEGRDLRGLDPREFADAVVQAVQWKPLDRLPSTPRPMVTLGG